ncbi:TonB-denpendent receptor [Asticcacaulis sp. AC460]|uniref:TonB-dependent receptor n=1 Tax=Asticcacaulis sp. AC460 TaxID=1282360 RepID=UPI0003C402E7|nr:TonB-dependent receptor [Asticcacaulis sp. AC460]ESQ89878.1 TonB-denpendent receptor [Asticcacaulis sp. AC460]
MLSRKSARLAVLLGGVSTLVFAVPAMAQEEGEEVIVTATRRSEAARDVPLAVSAISGEKLGILNSSGQDIRLLSGRVPSLIAESSFGRTYPRFYIRGLGNTDYDVNAAQPVSVVYDDVALENPILKAFPIFDVASVEVLRGPQGTLFGRNTPAGVIKINSAKPSDVFGGFGSASVGTYGSTNLEAAVTGPLADGINFRLSGQIQHRDDWVENTATTGVADDMLEGYTDRAARAQISYKKGNFDALFNIHARSLDGTPRVFRAGLFKQGSNDFSDGFDVEKVALDGVTSQSLSSSGVGIQLNYVFDGVGTLHSITGYETAKVESSGDIDGGDTYTYPPLGLNNALFPSSTGGISKPQELSQEVRFEFDPWGNVSAQAGVYFFEQKLYYNELNYDGAGAVNANVLHENYQTNYGLFVSGEYKPTDLLTVRGGLRFSADRKTDEISGTPVLTGVTLPAESTVRGDNVSGDLSLTYEVSPTTNIYARIATGYLGPAIQDRVNFVFTPTVPTVEEQTTTSYETGIKSVYFGRKLTLDASIYGYETENLQLTAVGGSNNSAKLINAEKAIGYGLELDLTAKPIPNLLLTAGASYNYTEIQDPTLGVGPCGSGMCTVKDPVVGGLAMIDGNPLPQAPKYVANFTARYAWPLENGGQVFAYTDWFYRSEVNFFLYEAVEFEGKPEFIGGLRVGYLTDEGTEFAVFVRNITDEIRAESAIDFNNLTGMVNDPRTFGIAVRKSF